MSEEKLVLICDTDGERVDKFLAQTLPQISRNQARKLIASGQVQIATADGGEVTNGKALKTSTRLSAGTQLIVTLIAPSTEVVSQAIPLDILFEDEALLILNKQAGLVVHPAAGHQEGTLINGLLHHYPHLATLPQKRMGLVHRLDRDTSGVMVVAKTDAVLTALQKQFKARTVEKIYVALIHGYPPAKQGTIDVPLGRDLKNRQKFAPRPNGKPAKTHYVVKETYQHYTLLQVTLETGRTHQIRVHFAWLGHPVAGDQVYGYRRKRDNLPRQFLHARQLTFNHPISGAEQTFEAPLPTDLADYLQKLN